jgi:hypothetical protein
MTKKNIFAIFRKMMKKNVLFFSYSLLVLSFAYGQQDPPPIEKGTLIVTWKTDGEGTCMERIRFWLKNSKMEQTLYPKQNAYVDDAEEKCRMVVVENLKPDEYIVEFLVPNRDGCFQIPPPKAITVAAGETVKVNQEFTLSRDGLINN